MYLRFNNYFAPPDAITEPTSKGTLSVDDIADALSDDTDDKDDVLKLDDQKDDKEADKDDESKDDDADSDDDNEDEEDEDLELKELEDELEDKEEKLEELVTPVRLSEITKKYPDLFKDFPYLKSAYHREREFTELLPTIDDAKEAVEAKRAWDNLDRDLAEGNTAQLLKVIKQQSPEAFNKIADNYLESLYEADHDAYVVVAQNVVKDVIYKMAVKARANGDEDLMNNATALNEFVFGSKTYEDKKKLSKPTDSKEDEKAKDLERREREFNERTQNTVKNDINSRVDNLIKKTIGVNIDPKNNMTAYIRRNAEREVFEEVDKLLKKDTRTNAFLTKLWERAAKNNYSEETTNQIRTLRLSKAKALLPAIIKKVRNEALKGVSARKAKENEEVEEKDDTKEVKRHKVTSAPKKTGDNSRRRPEGMSTRDLLGYD